MLLIVTICFYTPTGSFNRDFSNSLEQFLNLIQHLPDFCTSQNVPDDAPTSFVRYRTINGTCNNLGLGNSTLGTAGTITARFLPESMYLNLQLYIEKGFGVICFHFVKLFEIAFFTHHVRQMPLRISLSVIFL